MNIHARRLTALAAAAILWSALPAAAETFRFKFRDGDQWRVNSVVNETAYINRIPHHTAEITYRATLKVSDVRSDSAGIASARHDCTFMTSEKTSNRTLPWGKEYPSSFRRNALGTLEIDDSYFMPVVRNVPSFPAGDVQVGQSWKGAGEEAHDFRDDFGIEKPFRVPFEVTYTYVGPRERDGKKLHLIAAEYSIFFDSPSTLRAKPGSDVPVTTMGWSKQKILWDNERGIMDSYSEEFRIQLQLDSGRTFEWRGTSEATTAATGNLDRERIADDLNDEISRLGIADARNNFV